MSFDSWLNDMISTASGVGQEKRRLFYNNEENKMASGEKIAAGNNATSINVAGIGAEASRYGDDVRAKASMYGADMGAKASMYGADQGLAAHELSDKGQTYRQGQQLTFERDRQTENAALQRTQIGNQGAFQTGSLVNEELKTRGQLAVEATKLDDVRNMVTTVDDLGNKTTMRGVNPNMLTLQTPQASRESSTEGLINRIVSPPAQQGIDLSPISSFLKQKPDTMKPEDFGKLATQIQGYPADQRREVLGHITKTNPGLATGLNNHLKVTNSGVQEPMMPSVQPYDFGLSNRILKMWR